MNTALLAIVLLQSPRQAETFGGVQMERDIAPKIPMAILLPTSDRATNSFSWGASMEPSRQADGYLLRQRSNTGITNFYATTGTNITIEYVWPNGVERWHYEVCATNEWGESDWTTNRCHNPPYPPDRMDIWVNGEPSFPLQTSQDMKTWGQPFASTRRTVSLTGSRGFYRSPGMKLEIVAYNPLNQ